MGGTSRNGAGAPAPTSHRVLDRVNPPGQLPATSSFGVDCAACGLCEGGNNMRQRRITVTAVGVAIALAGTWAIQSLYAQQPGFNRVELQRHDLSTPGRETVQVRAEFSPGGTVGKHTHP